MPILFFDTETTGLPDDRQPLASERQPHIVQLAALLTDEEGQEMTSISMIVNPGVPIPTRASDVHGITDQVAEAYGVNEGVAVRFFANVLAKADMVVAHNLKFDDHIMRIAYARQNGQPSKEPDNKFCTMEAASPVVNLPPTERMIAAGISKPKPPRLEECISHFFGERLDGAHDALVDVRACARLFFHLRALKAEAAAREAQDSTEEVV